MNRAISVTGRPRIELAPGEIAVDPHIHSLFSHCSVSRPERIIRRAAALGLMGVAVLDHDSIDGSRDAAACARYLIDAKAIPEGFLIIPGLEINSKKGHIGALFVDEKLPNGRQPEETVRLIHDAGGIAVAMHPYHSTGVGETVFDVDFDAVETECASVLPLDLVERNRALASDERLAGLARLGGSDAHYVSGIAACYTTVSGLSSLTLDALKEAILARRSEAKCSEPCRRLRRLLGPISRLR